MLVCLGTFKYLKAYRILAYVTYNYKTSATYCLKVTINHAEFDSSKVNLKNYFF